MLCSLVVFSLIISETLFVLPTLLKACCYFNSNKKKLKEIIKKYLQNSKHQRPVCGLVWASNTLWLSYEGKWLLLIKLRVASGVLAVPQSCGSLFCLSPAHKHPCPSHPFLTVLIKHGNGRDEGESMRASSDENKVGFYSQRLENGFIILMIEERHLLCL